ncbi:hypothetical protein M3Y98_00708200 [Aphelenchoides besseyi]|nr:hypothetical protein M3Y98_00708200 [Aphelenchoides besseyi]KAI6210357.1 hypothetical protein M3Y96_00319700 [Aphelenchoides besseyi]
MAKLSFFVVCSVFSCCFAFEPCTLDNEYRKPGIICLEMQNLGLVSLSPHPKWKSLINVPGENFSSTKTIIAPTNSRVIMALQNLTWSQMDRFIYNAGKCLHGKLRIFTDPKNNETTFTELCNQVAPVFVSKENELKIEQEVIRFAADGLRYQPFYSVVKTIRESEGPYANRPIHKIEIRQSAHGMVTEIPALYDKGSVLSFDIRGPNITEYSMCVINIFQPCASSSDVLKVQFSGRITKNSTQFVDGDSKPKEIPRDLITAENGNYAYGKTFSSTIGRAKLEQKRVLRNEYLRFFYEMNGDVDAKWSVSWDCNVYANSDLDAMDSSMFKTVFLSDRVDSVRAFEKLGFADERCEN